MNQEDIKKLSELFSEFTKNCGRVGNIIHNVTWLADLDYEHANICHSWSIEGNNVCGHAFDRCGDYVACEFPLEYLTLTDQQLNELVDKINQDCYEKIRKEKEEEQKRIAEETRKKELEELKRLQEKYKDEL